jgi:hypothetical protein
LQRALTDFGADVSFGQAAEKMREHYRLEVPACMIQKITEKHAREMSKLQPSRVGEPVRVLIAEMDGGMVPIVEVGEKVPGIDLRKTRKVCWKEAKLCFARVHKKIDRVYGAIIGTPDEAGSKLYECAKKAGFGDNIHVHALGDGAQWIVDQVDSQFGVQAYILSRFFSYMRIPC